MKNSFIILTFFIAGIICGLLLNPPENFPVETISLWILYILILLVGVTVGADLEAFKLIKSMKFKIFLLPAATIIGTFSGVLALSFFLRDISVKELIAVGSGFGYYSISSVIISQITGDKLGVIALLANVFREIITLLLTPLFVKFLGKFAPISSGGATSMDTTLPVISKFCGKEYSVISVFHGTILTILVPVIIPIILGAGVHK
ncbi:MAG: lysine exporter LysO family protein [bacterium]|nr:lysine exporter LysO family protein [bacterium]